MYLLAIETSCDETAVALLQMNGESVPKFLAEEISSQVELHESYGGVVPELAAREHLRNLPLLIDKVLENTGIQLPQVNAIGVTRGPGLKGCLLIGLGIAKGISVAQKIPLLGINHIEGHMLVPLAENDDLEFPFLALVVSGGHTEILEIHGLGNYKLVARTIDDAAGEAFDKSANLLGFPYPGGAKLAAEADKHGSTEYSLPRVMRESEGFSFSGLKTAISLLIQTERDRLQDSAVIGSLAYAIQESIVDALCFKLGDAVSRTGISKVVVTGGVSANRFLRAKVEEMKGVRAYFPRPEHCTDNAAMIGYVACLRYQRGERSSLETDVLSRWPVETVE